ncbi:zinc-ribbon domain-containing protein, partial [Streptomyces sp. KLMMK]
MTLPCCPACGSTLPAEARFCMKCGRERPQETEPAAAPGGAGA